MAVSFVISRFGSEVRPTLLLALPLVLGHVSTGLIGFVLNVIAGHHSTVTLAASTIGTALLWLPMLVPMGTLISLTVLVSQLHGAERERDIGPLFRQALWLAMLLGLVMFTFLSVVPALLPLFGIVPDIVPGAAKFLHVVRWGSLAFPLYFCMRYFCEGMHCTFPTMLLGFGGLLVLVPLSYALTYGRFGFAEYGVEGLGIATVTVMWLQAVVFALYLWRSRRFAHLQLFAHLELPCWARIRDLLNIGLPIGISILMEGGLFIVTTLLIGRFGTDEIAAHQIALSVAQLCFMIPMGVAEATTVRIGHAVGRCDLLVMRRVAWAGYAIVIGTQTLSASVLLLGYDVIVAAYTDDLVVASLASKLLLFAAIFQFPDGLQMLSSGVLRGMKDTRVPMLLAMISYWGLGMPLGLGLGFALEWNSRGMWIGLIIGLTAAALLLGWRFRVVSERMFAGIP
ncbi:MATE family efflux transporter [Xylella fastidiosa subsp. fastidiosa]|jgi:MATE family multidrug resistance protein|nr:MATE family efflux transporter [Xylella fastidiosa]ADN62905.1 multidrug efflux protein [Xylella fastidiosa subsp. fastidiosa GB514]ACB93542.1 MATE efflux family protein [Xylella fastidiosa M23]EGO82956.1 Na+-driven multidrug efflux pump NorM [Xylella fastidiosa EB92.1]KGM19810.1 multidrug transporter MatE [Xylella fastidiosa]MBE0261444.1 MATE family efflux transporter [Xylella fastidiosa subsp. fastidiosa]